MPGPRTNQRPADGSHGTGDLESSDKETSLRVGGGIHPLGPNGPMVDRFGAPLDSAALNVSPAEQEFIEAMREYRASSGRLFPTWSEVLEVLQKLGYRKVDPESPPISDPS